MSRSNWKYLPFWESDCLLFLNRFLFWSLVRFKTIQNWPWKRFQTINLLNYCSKGLIHQGKVKHVFRLYRPTLSYKIGMFSKTRKPFFFRSKKKKKINVRKRKSNNFKRK